MMNPGHMHGRLRLPALAAAFSLMLGLSALLPMAAFGQEAADDPQGQPQIAATEADQAAEGAAQGGGEQGGAAQGSAAQGSAAAPASGGNAAAGDVAQLNADGGVDEAATTGEAANDGPTDAGGTEGAPAVSPDSAAGEADGGGGAVDSGTAPAGTPDATDAGASADTAIVTAAVTAPATASTSTTAAAADTASTADPTAAATPEPAAAATAATAAKKATVATSTTAATAAKKASAAKAKAGWYTIATVANGKLVLQVKGSSAKAGTAVVLAKAGYGTAQAFKLEKVSGSYFRIMCGTGQGSRIYVSSKGKVSLVTQKAGRNSMFKLVATGGGYRIVNLATGRALAFSGSSAKSGVKLVTKKAKASDTTQQFSLAARDGLLKGGIYTVRTTLSGKRAASPKGASTKANAKAAIETYTGSISQRWQITKVAGKSNVYTIEDLATGYRLCASGVAAKLKKASSGSKAQMWKAIGYNGKVIFKNVKTGKVLQPAGGKKAAGTALKTAKETDAKAQRWTVKHVAAMGSGIYELDLSANTGLALEVAGSSAKAGATVRVAKDANGAGQRWVYDSSTGTFTNANSGMVLAAGGAAAGAGITQAAYSGAATQKWKVSYLGGGKFRISSAANSALVLGVGSATANAAAGLAKKGGASTQAWHAVQAKNNITTYEALGFSVEQMARWQKAGNPYLASYTVSYLKTVIDPANGSKYKFLDLRKTTGVSASVLDAFINTSGSDGKLKGLGSAFVEAAKKYSLNEVYLLAHAILESGWGKSTLSMGYKYSGGYIDGKYYKKGTYYNFYGIGAYDSSPLSGGRKMAIINGWTTPAKAVSGAAKWISANYVHASSYAQTTVYSMKWDLARTKATKAYGWHQYATSVTWADSIGNLMGQVFSAAKKGTGLTFIVPKYR